MIKTLQIIALFQGLFVLVVLFANRKEYKKMTFRLIFGALVSIILYIIGDDENNLFFEGVDLFLFDSSLFITFLFLFFRYYNNGKESFAKLDYLFFIPNLIYFIIELIEINSQSENFIVEIIEVLIEFTFFAYLCILFYSIINELKQHLNMLKTELKNKVIIGTAQFGLDYGIFCNPYLYFIWVCFYK